MIELNVVQSVNCQTAHREDLLSTVWLWGQYRRTDGGHRLPLMLAEECIESLAHARELHSRTGCMPGAPARHLVADVPVCPSLEE